METNRRQFLLTGVGLGAACSLPGSMRSAHATASVREHESERDSKALFSISLAEWSLHRALRAGEMENLDFPGISRNRFGIAAVEYVSSFFKDKAVDFEYLAELKRRSVDADVRNHLIMIDGEGRLADPDDARRRKAVQNHFRWIAAAAYLGCLTIRVNAGGSGGFDEQMALAADSLQRLGEMGDEYGINVIVENHGGLSSNGKWLAGVMKKADHPRVGTLPDFGNFRIKGDEWYDRYEGVKEMMPFAKAVSAKSYGFDEKGNETTIDYRRMMRIVLDAGYRALVGVEYEGNQLSEDDGVFATKRLLETIRGELEGEY